MMVISARAVSGSLVVSISVTSWEKYWEDLDSTSMCTTNSGQKSAPWSHPGPLCCANIQSRIENLKKRISPTLCDLPLISSSKIAVSQESAVVIGFEPVIEMHLIDVGSHEFFSQSFIVSTYEGYGETREKSNCGLEDVVGIGGAVGIACLHLAQCCRDDQQAMWVVAYPF